MLKHARYEPGEILGRGAQGVVISVVDREAPTLALVAKVWSAGAFGKGLLEGEFALLARVRAPGLVRAHDFGRDEGTGAPFLVEERVDGPDARAFVVAAPSDRERGARMSAIVTDVARTLVALSDAGFTHGDLKPAHVRIPAGGHARVLDLGAAVANGAGAVALTPEYAAPEVRAGARPSALSDLYSLGALAWAAACGKPPSGARVPLRTLAPFVPPSLADVIDALLAAHPRDRPASARDVLLALGRSEACGVATSALLGRDSELARLRSLRSGVHYVTGAAGAGKSHLVRELSVRLLLEGREARVVALPCDDAVLARKLVAWLRGAADAWPFAALPSALALVLDDLPAAPRELAEALEAFRCRPGAAPSALVIATCREAPPGAPVVRLGLLDHAMMSELARALGAPNERLADLVRQAEGHPGWLAAALGRVPLSRDSAQARAKSLGTDARALLATIALLGGEISRDLASRVVGAVDDAFAELAVAALVTRRADESQVVFSLSTRAIADDLAAALGTFEIVDRVAVALIADAKAPARALLAIAGATNPPSERTALLTRASERARVEGARSVETDALLALAADPRQRTPEVLVALDVVTRGGGSAGLFDQLVPWLEAERGRAPGLAVLALRRRAEQHARRGDFEPASALATEALEAARTASDPEGEALAFSTIASVALHRADWAEAERAVASAAAMIASGTVGDAEEVARLDHNRGVVALYRERLDEATAAFERSVEKKRRMGDRGGVWACLVNLGLVHGKAERYVDAGRAFDEALALTRSMGQPAGTAWCLAAIAEVAVLRGDAASAERAIAEADQLGDAVPAPVGIDLALARAEVFLLESDARAALATVAAIDPDDREADALTDARVLVLESRALLGCLPVDRRGAARAAVRGIRRARAAGLPEHERAAIRALAAARSSGASVRAVVNRSLGGEDDARPRAERYDTDVADDAAWRWLETVSTGLGRDEAARNLAALVIDESGAERAFIVIADGRGSVQEAWGADVEGISIERPEARVPEDVVLRASAGGTPAYSRDIETPGGRGSRLAIGTGGRTALRAVVIAEHRFVVGRFDTVSEERARRWATLAGMLAFRSSTASGTPGAASHESVSVTRSDAPSLSVSVRGETTAIPLARARRAFPGIIGDSPAMRTALVRLDAAVESDLPLLIAGETGVGKELVARAVHDHGHRAKLPFIAVSCAAIPETLFEAELFGHARGSFTGAERARPGLVARAEGGTLFLDEIGELPLVRQAVLLRALETRTFRPVGADEEKPFDVRIVAATNRNLEREVERGSFRRDLLYRINVLEVEVPPLRDRPEDVAILVRHFLDRSGSDAEVAPDALLALESHAWPGNVRELEHQIQRLAAARVLRIERRHLPREIRAARSIIVKGRRSVPASPEEEKDEVGAALVATRGNITHAAKRLGLTRHGLKKKMVRLGLRAPSVQEDVNRARGGGE